MVGDRDPIKGAGLELPQNGFKALQPESERMAIAMSNRRVCILMVLQKGHLATVPQNSGLRVRKQIDHAANRGQHDSCE